MKTLIYEVIFKVTETCQNGNERRLKKSVFIPCIDPITNKHIITLRRIERGTDALKELNYYNIEYIETKVKTLIFG